MAKNDRLYILSSRHSWRSRVCVNCGADLKEGDTIFTKARANGAKHYCGACAEKVGLITQDQLRRITSKKKIEIAKIRIKKIPIPKIPQPRIIKGDIRNVKGDNKK